MIKRATMNVGIAIISICCCAMSSCTIWDRKQWDSLQDRTFHFQEFTFICNGYTEKRAFELMRDFPLEDIFRAIAERYRVGINDDDFRAFIAAGDESAIDAYGMLRDKKFIWKSPKEHRNTMVIEYAVQFGYETTDVERTYVLALKTRGRARSIISGSVDDREGIPESVRKKLFGRGW